MIRLFVAGWTQIRHDIAMDYIKCYCLEWVSSGRFIPAEIRWIGRTRHEASVCISGNSITHRSDLIHYAGRESIKHIWKILCLTHFYSPRSDPAVAHGAMLEMPGPPTEDRWEQMPFPVTTVTLVILSEKDVNSATTVWVHWWMSEKFLNIVKGFLFLTTRFNKQQHCYFAHVDNKTLKRCCHAGAFLNGNKTHFENSHMLFFWT